MKRGQLLGHLIENGCVLHREGSNHTIYKNLKNGQQTAVPRHPDIVEKTAFNICKQLDIPKPKIN